MQAGAAALLLALAIGIPAGVLGSRARSSIVRHGISAISILLLSVPALVVALVLAVVASGAGVPSFAVMVISLALPAAAVVERLQSRAMDAVQRETCLDAARARGVPRGAITWRHAWPLSLPSVLGVVGIIAGHLLSGALAIELVTARSGLGLLTFEALMARDLDLAAACAASAALIVGLATLAADLAPSLDRPAERGAVSLARASGGFVLAVLGLCAVCAPWLATGDIATQHPDLALAPPSLSRRTLVERLPPTYRTRDERLPLTWFSGTLVHGADPSEPLLPLGSDSLGRDQWTRLLYGARLSLGLTLSGLAGAVLIGTVVGLLAGRREGWLDTALMRVADLFIAWPALYVVLVLRAALPLSLPFTTLFALMSFVLTLAGWPIVARAVRAVTASERARESVLAAEAAGASPAWILERHLLPAAWPVIVTQALLLVPAFILAEATLSFVSLGFSEPTPSWGTMLREASNPFTLRHAPWLLAPAGAIALVTLGVNLLAEDR